MPEFTLPPRPYDHTAPEPHIDTLTMQIHHGKHHQAYVTNLNNALKEHADLQNKSVEDLLKGINTAPEAIRMAVRNNGGGHYNHSMFWEIMKPGASHLPTRALSETSNRSFSGARPLTMKHNHA